jgi:CubicO group peptidase (beta-lactamase class C family)
MKHLKNMIILFLISSLFLSPAAAQNAITEKKIDDYFTRLSGFGFSGAVLVARNGQILIEKGYGAADRKRNIPATKDTAFDIGSNAKDFTRMAILQLAEKKKLSVDDVITRFFDNVPADKAAITVTQLMDHTAGLGMYSGRDVEKVTSDEFRRRVFSAALISEPGKRENYSNPGYGLLAAIIERVSGQTYEQYLEQHIFKPAGMTSTGYLIPKWRDGQLAHSYANGEDRGSTFDVPHLPDGISWSLRGAGGILATLGDMYKFHLALEGEQLLSKGFKDKLFDMNGPATLVGGNGVHFFVYSRDPASRIAVLIASTDAGVRATEIDEHVMSLAHNKEVTLPPQTTRLEPAALAKLEGNYTLPSGASLSVSVRSDHLFVSGSNQEGFSLLAGARRGPPDQMNRMSAQVKEMLEASAKGDHSLIHRAFGAAMPLDDFKPRQEALWQRRKEQFGQFKAVTILGTVPGQGDYVTTARLDFERGVDYAQFTWGGGMLRGIRPSTPAPGTKFFPQSATGFVSFRPGPGESITLTFKPDEKTSGFNLSVESSAGAVASNTTTDKAVREKLPDTAAGRIAAAYFKAFNTGDEKTMIEFFQTHLSKASQASRPIDERLKIYKRMRDDLGDLKADTVSDDTESGLTVTMPTKDGGSVEFRFEMDPAEPSKLKALRVELR